jgi:hypothetical protein
VKYAAESEDWPSNTRPVQLRCDAGTKFLIVKADFGRDKYLSACGDYFYDGNCTSVVATTVFPDPCYGQPKLLRVWYQCIGDGMFVAIIN